MPFTISEKILAAHASREAVRPGELIEAELDFVFGNDITAPLAIQVFKEGGGIKVFDSGVYVGIFKNRGTHPLCSTKHVTGGLR